MTLNRANYERLPQSSWDLQLELLDVDHQKRPAIHRYFSLQLRKTRRIFSRIGRPLNLFSLIIVLLGVQSIFNGSYLEDSAPRFQLDTQEKVYIAANIIDGDLIKNEWGSSLISLVELIGSERVFVSIYGGPRDSLSELSERLKCDHKIVSEESEPIDLEKLPKIHLPNGDWRIKRISFLAEVRNKALQPLAELEQQGKSFDKILFLNDVHFRPTEALRLIWGTNMDENGRAQYRAACAADFVTSWKYYDTFATRDFEGYSLGVPIFPWFSSEGLGVSRKDVLSGRDSVQVKSCWGGMVSFDARYFISTKRKTNETIGDPHQYDKVTFPVRFRSEPEPFWDASECCLIHADIIALPSFHSKSSFDELNTEIFMNPFVRTAYSAQALSWIPIIKRFERLMTPIQWLTNKLVKMPRFNYRRTEKSGQIIDDLLWVEFNATLNATEKNYGHSGLHSRHTQNAIPAKSNIDWLKNGYYKHVQRVAGHGGFCGVRQLTVLREGYSRENNGKGGENWDNLLTSVPPLYFGNWNSAQD